ncbi:MAG: hypothetical protein D4R65_04665 [Verrucomicrobiaceae bacterium]|nr:MAG: hypothetical protein D4R65_04665 [Verrucomicrobiaceae bacterium]
MKTLAPITIALALATLTINAPAQQGGGPGQPPGGEDKRGKAEALTDAQVKQVGAILAGYDAQALTADQARAIHGAFRQAGLPGGPAINEAVAAAGFSPEKLRDLDPRPSAPGGDQRAPKSSEQNPPPGGKNQSDGGKAGGPQQYSIEQAASDNAQLHTIAFNGLAFVTGDFGADTFLPPGKVCDFFGFQYMRDIDAAHKGHNPVFLDRVAGNVLQVLTDEQRAVFEKAAEQEAGELRSLAGMRLPLIKAFCRQLAGDIPAGSQGLNKAAVIKYVSDIFAADAEVSYQRAQIFGQVASSLSAQQKESLAKMTFGDFNTWPAVDMEKYKLPRGTEKMINVAYMTFASEFFSWYAGSVKADTYFCPERHGTYFGGFYMKDMPAMGKRDFDISTSVTGDSGKEFLNILTEDQRKDIIAIPDLQRKDLQEIISVRESISKELRKFLSGGQADKETVLALGRRYGELDGEMSYYYATAFATANSTLTADQRQALVKLRNLDGYTSAPAYIYSDPVNGPVNLPATDSFFFPPTS